MTREQKIQQSSDYFKAVFGCRPHNGDTDDDAVAAYDAAAQEMVRRASTPAGRNALREDGWCLNGDPGFDYREPTT